MVTFDLAALRLHAGDTLEVRALRMADADAYYDLCRRNREHLSPWMEWVPEGGVTRGEIREFLRESEKAARAQTQCNAAILENGELAGSVAFRGIDWRNRIAQIGYWLAHDRTGRGLMTRAVRALTDYGFTVLEFNRIEIRCATENRASAAVAERLGFKHEGTLRQAQRLRERYVDDHVFAMLREDWRKSSA